jgi:hypothetical protein
MTELNELNVKNKHENKGEASSSTLVEDLLPMLNGDTRKLKQSIKLIKQVKFDN